jgi:hypothetical protein
LVITNAVNVAIARASDFIGNMGGFAVFNFGIERLFISSEKAPSVDIETTYRFQSRNREAFDFKGTLLEVLLYVL